MYLYAILAYLAVLVGLGIYQARRAQTGDDDVVRLFVNRHSVK